MTLEDKLQKASEEVANPIISDAIQIQNAPEKPIKLPKVVYDRVKAFNTEEATDAGWTDYGIIDLIMGNIDPWVYWRNPVSDEQIVPVEPPEEFYQWLRVHKYYGPDLIMLAVIYDNYKLEE